MPASLLTATGYTFRSRVLPQRWEEPQGRWQWLDKMVEGAHKRPRKVSGFHADSSVTPTFYADTKAALLILSQRHGRPAHQFAFVFRG